MKIKIKVDNVIYYDDYESFEEVDAEFYNNVIYINCNNHKLTNIEFINRFPNLKTLIASNNFLTHIPDHQNLEVLDVNTNKIRQLGYYPKLLKIFAFNNILTYYNVPFSVYQLDLSNNRLKYLNFNKKQIFSLFNIEYNNFKNETKHIDFNTTQCNNIDLYTIYE
jgi:hypothetical protein